MTDTEFICHVERLLDIANEPYGAIYTVEDVLWWDISHHPLDHNEDRIIFQEQLARYQRVKRAGSREQIPS